MRLLRISFLQTYLSVLNENKNKALFLINVGIFFTIFALSSASISFFIEKKISDYQNELLIMQMDAKWASNMISGLEVDLNNYDLLGESEEHYRREKQFFSYTELGSRTFSQEDFYIPYNYVGGESLNEFEEMLTNYGYAIFDIENEYNQELFKRLKEGWRNEEVEEFINTINTANKAYKNALNINFEKYNLKKIPSLEEIKSEILNKNNHIFLDESEYENDYYTILDFEKKARNYFQIFLKAVKGDAAGTRDEIKRVNNIIINLSKNERNIIVLTFILQFIVFIIIQFFEINSLNFNFKKTYEKKTR